jgi:hypothetical protein
MSYQIPSLRARRSGAGTARPRFETLNAPTPLAAPEIVAALREAVCDVCPNNSKGRCRLFACCQKDIAATVKMATQQCPAGHWKRWLPNNE